MTSRLIVLEGAVDEQLAAAWSHVGTAPVVTFLDPFGVAALPRDVFTGRLLDATGLPLRAHEQMSDLARRTPHTHAVRSVTGRAWQNANSRGHRPPATPNAAAAAEGSPQDAVPHLHTRHHTREPSFANSQGLSAFVQPRFSPDSAQILYGG
jgi:hypothetical protein